MLVIEHNLDVIKSADWIIDLGPEGGSGGGTVVAEGTPEQVAAHPESYTGQFLRHLVEPEVAPAAAAEEGRQLRAEPSVSAAGRSGPRSSTPASRALRRAASTDGASTS